MSQGLPPAGWYPDRLNPSMVRWWDGASWTSHTHPAAAADAETAHEWDQDSERDAAPGVLAGPDPGADWVRGYGTRIGLRGDELVVQTTNAVARAALGATERRIRLSEVRSIRRTAPSLLRNGSLIIETTVGETAVRYRKHHARAVVAFEARLQNRIMDRGGSPTPGDDDWLSLRPTESPTQAGQSWASPHDARLLDPSAPTTAAMKTVGKPTGYVRTWRWMRRHPKSSIAAVVVLVVLGIGAASAGNDEPENQPSAGGGTTAPAPRATAPTSTPTGATEPGHPPGSPKVSSKPVDRLQQRSGQAAVAVLQTLPIRGRAPMTGYSREQFGQAWSDDNDNPMGHNGCDTRNDILRRDLIMKRLDPDTGGCVVLTGLLRDPYTSETVHFRRGETSSLAVQIDHLVALGDAWQTGAQHWSLATRTDLGNDPLNLLAVDGPTNEAKGDGDAATWLPPNKAYRCDYVARQIAVKARYHLWVTQAEHDAMARVLRTCPDQRVPQEARPVPLVASSKRTPHPGPTDVYYANCSAAVAAGAAPLFRGQSGYRPELDGDDDGVACED